MSQPLFTGSGVALVTPMTPDSIDLPALDRLIDRQLDAGTDALIICATTGEGATLTYAERAEIIERTVRQVNGRIPVIVGTGSNNTASAAALSPVSTRRNRTRRQTVESEDENEIENET